LRAYFVISLTKNKAGCRYEKRLREVALKDKWTPQNSWRFDDESPYLHKAVMSVTPAATRNLLDEFETKRQKRKRLANPSEVTHIAGNNRRQNQYS
jgi:hypothetical protein